MRKNYIQAPSSRSLSWTFEHVVDELKQKKFHTDVILHYGKTKCFCSLHTRIWPGPEYSNSGNFMTLSLERFPNVKSVPKRCYFCRSLMD